MDQFRAQIDELRAEIARQEAELADLEAELLDIQRELDDFTDRYNRVIKPLRDRLEIIQSVIAGLEAEKHTPPQPFSTEWTPPPGYVPVEEQYRQTWQVPREQAGWMPGSEPVDYKPSDSDSETALKRLYRQLARRYHPDLVTDPAERERRNRLMAEINEAYTRRDFDALQALAQQPDGVVIEEPLDLLQLRRLRQISDQLFARLLHLKHERSDLLNSDLMWLKVQASLAAGRGRDLLREMATQLERDYAACLDRLDDLRRS